MFRKFFPKKGTEATEKSASPSTPPSDRPLLNPETLAILSEIALRFSQVEFPIQTGHERPELIREVAFYIDRSSYIPDELTAELMVSRDCFFEILEFHPNFFQFVPPANLGNLMNTDLLSRMYLYNPNGLQLLVSSTFDFNSICTVYYPRTNTVDVQGSFISSQFNPQLEVQQNLKYPSKPHVVVRTYPQSHTTTRMRDTNVPTLEFVVANWSQFLSNLSTNPVDISRFLSDPVSPIIDLGEQVITPTKTRPAPKPAPPVTVKEDDTLKNKERKNKTEMLYLNRGLKGFVKLAEHQEPMHVEIVDVGEVFVTVETYGILPEDMRQVINKHHPEILECLPNLFEVTIAQALDLLRNFQNGVYSHLAQGISSEVYTLRIPKEELIFRFTETQAIHAAVFVNPLYFVSNEENLVNLKPLRSFKKYLN